MTASTQGAWGSWAVVAGVTLAAVVGEFVAWARRWGR